MKGRSFSFVENLECAKLKDGKNILKPSEFKAKKKKFNSDALDIYRSLNFSEYCGHRSFKNNGNGGIGTNGFYDVFGTSRMFLISEIDEEKFDNLSDDVYDLLKLQHDMFEDSFDAPLSVWDVYVRERGFNMVNGTSCLPNKYEPYFEVCARTIKNALSIAHNIIGSEDYENKEFLFIKFKERLE